MRNKLCLLLLSMTLCVHAQSFEEYKQQVVQEFDNYKSEQERAYKAYRDKINAEFARYMRQDWEKKETKPAEPIPDKPKPPAPVVKEPEEKPSDDPIPFADVIPAPKPVLPPQPAVPLPKPAVLPDMPRTPTFSFRFYGTECALSLTPQHRYTLRSVDENSVADVWTRLSTDSYLPVIAECLDWREKLSLCDWAYVRFLEQMTMAFFSPEQQNEARLMQMFILTQSGYKVRIARADDTLVLLLPSEEKIYEYTYLLSEGCRYYVTDKSLRNKSLYVLDYEFPKEQFFSLQMTTQPVLSEQLTEPHRHAPLRDPAMATETRLNSNLIEFYNDYPRSGAWHLYAQASLSESAKEQLYPPLRKAIEGKTELDAANMLLNFVQLAFEYKTDHEQFGYERPLFADETLYYPYCDCEDRSILFSILVHDLMGLTPVLLYYPGHLAAAVDFKSEVKGDHVMLDGNRYTVCDPTFIGAGVGKAMTQYKKTEAQVIKIYR